MTEPRNGWTLDCEEVIKGTYASEITEPIWAVLKYGSNFWPQEPIEQISPSWYGTVYFGECGKPEEYTGTPFQLIIVTANMNSLWT